MSSLQNKIDTIYSLEELSIKQSVIHSLHPFVKLVGTIVYLICVVSFGRYALIQLLPYLFYPLILIPLAKIPCSLVVKRTFVALPFCFFAGVSNIFFDKAPCLLFDDVVLRGGTLSFIVILFKTVLCVSAILLLVGVTPFHELATQLQRIYLPQIFISLFEITYRYIGTLLKEADTMNIAYLLRSKRKKIEMKHMGSFIGQLFLRSFDRAERIYHAMKCRGYGSPVKKEKRQEINQVDKSAFLLICGLCLLFRIIDLPSLILNFTNGGKG